MSSHFSPRPSFTLLLLSVLQAHSIIAAPSTLWRRDLSDQSTCHDLESYQNGALTSDMWAMTDASGYLSNWWNNHNGDTNFAANFANPWGLGQSFSCRFATPCARPSCQGIRGADDAGSGPAYEVLVALSNVNNYLVTFKQSLEASRARWASLQVAVQQKYWPNPPSDKMMMKQILNALNTIIACVAAAGTGPAAGIATGLSAGIAGGITLALDDKDDSLQHLADMETAADSWYEAAMSFLNTLNDDLMSVGHHNSAPEVTAAVEAILAGIGAVAGVTAAVTPTTIDIQPLLQSGLWSDYTNIPVLNTDASKPRVSVQELNDLFFDMILGQVINYSWKQQGVWIAKYDMTQEEFDTFYSAAGDNDQRLKLYYGGSAFFFQGLYWNGYIPCNQNPPGWGDVEGDTKGAITSQDILRSSADAWHDSGFDHQYTLSDVGTDDPRSLLTAGAKGRGFFTIPICDMGKDRFSSIIEFGGWLSQPGTCFPQDIKANWCDCRDNVDSSGRVFREQFSPEWQDNMSRQC